MDYVRFLRNWVCTTYIYALRLLYYIQTVHDSQSTFDKGNILIALGFVDNLSHANAFRSLLDVVQHFVLSCNYGNFVTYGYTVIGTLYSNSFLLNELIYY